MSVYKEDGNQVFLPHLDRIKMKYNVLYEDLTETLGGLCMIAAHQYVFLDTLESIFKKYQCLNEYNLILNRDATQTLFVFQTLIELPSVCCWNYH